MRVPRTTVTIRWVLAGLAAAGALGTLAWVLRRGMDWGTFDKTLYGLGLLLTSVVLIGPELVEWVVFPINRLVDHVLLPSESEPPPVDFTLARFYVTHGRHEEACEEYEKIIRYHPEQTAAYLEGIQAAAHTGDEEAALRFFKAGRRVMRSEDQRHLLENVYAIRHELLEPVAEEVAIALEDAEAREPAPETAAPPSDSAAG